MGLGSKMMQRTMDRQMEKLGNVADEVILSPVARTFVDEFKRMMGETGFMGPTLAPYLSLATGMIADMKDEELMEGLRKGKAMIDEIVAKVESSFASENVAK